MGGFRQVLRANEAALLQHLAATCADAAEERFRDFTESAPTTPQTRPVVHATPGKLFTLLSRVQVLKFISPVFFLLQQAHIPKAVMMILEKDPVSEQQKEQERLAQVGLSNHLNIFSSVASIKMRNRFYRKSKMKID